MGSRQALQTMLEMLLGSDNVYFQPPPTIQLKYPAIVYSLSNMETVKADNDKYLMHKEYMLIYIHKNPDDTITETITKIPMCRFDRRYVSDNMYHDTYTLYY